LLRNFILFSKPKVCLVGLTIEPSHQRYLLYSLLCIVLVNTDYINLEERHANWQILGLAKTPFARLVVGLDSATPE
jgi:hypothetical protein